MVAKIAVKMKSINRIFIAAVFVISCAAVCSVHSATKRVKAPSKNVVHHPVNAEVTYILDGDTFSARVMLEEGMEISVRVRFMNIDAPEMNGMCESEIIAAHASRDRLEELIPVGSRVVLTGVKDDKYLGRIDAFVADGRGRDVGDIMVAEGFARIYGGGKRDGWCN